jgi:NAD(P)-dependent dehydrogenase (short-subunit alcohol dehydrogenase family)
VGNCVFIYHHGQLASANHKSLSARKESAFAGKELGESFCNEWTGKNVNGNAIVPGYISTHNTEALRNDTGRNKTIPNHIPAERWGEPKIPKGHW